MSDFLKDIIKETGNEYASLVSDGASGDVTDFIDTGSYIFNALLGGGIHRGLPSNKITAIAGESATGKTFFVLGMCKNFLDQNPDGGVIFFESESAVTKDIIEEREIDSSRMVIMPVTTVQEFRHQAITVLDKYIDQDPSERKPLLLVLDSLGMLSTTKEMEDTQAGKETKDMTRAQIVKAAFRVLTLKLGKAKVPLVITNHTMMLSVVCSLQKKWVAVLVSNMRLVQSYTYLNEKKKTEQKLSVILFIVKITNPD